MSKRTEIKVGPWPVRGQKPTEHQQPTEWKMPTERRQTTEGQRTMEWREPTEGREITEWQQTTVLTTEWQQPTEWKTPTEGRQTTEWRKLTEGREPTEGRRTTEWQQRTEWQKPTEGQQPVKCSPWDDRVHKNIRQIFISHGESINSIQTAYYDGCEIVLFDKHGGDGEKFDIINVDASDRLIEVSGYYGHYSKNKDDPVVIRSLRFTTRFSKYGPFGYEQGTPFIFKLGPNAFAGFHGESSDKFLHSIGIHVRTLATKQDGVPDKTCCRCM